MITNIAMISHDRHRLLRQSIESLYAHTDRESFNLVVCDDGSTDFRATKFLRELPYPNYSLVEVRNSGHVLSQLKNMAVGWSGQRFGHHDWLYISDSDVFFAQGWLDKLIATAEVTEPHRFALWGGQIHPFHQPLYGTNPTDWSQWDKDGGNKTVMTEHSVLDGPSWLMRWKTWRRYGPFDRTTAAGVCMSEEYPFCNKLISGCSTYAGHRIGVINPHVVSHTGLTNSNGEPAPGYEERLKICWPGVLYE